MGYASAFCVISLRNSLGAGPDADALLIDSQLIAVRYQEKLPKIEYERVCWSVRYPHLHESTYRGVLGFAGESVREVRM